MESVNYEYFDSENDYSKNPNATKHRSFNVSRGDFSKYAILNGFYGKKLISRDARKFYSSMCRMAVKKEKGPHGSGQLLRTVRPCYALQPQPLQQIGELWKLLLMLFWMH